MRDVASGEQRFWLLAEPLLAHAGVERSTMMGLPCLRLHGAFFAGCDRRIGHLVVKLPQTRVDDLIDSGRAQPFAPAGRRFRGMGCRSRSNTAGRGDRSSTTHSLSSSEQARRQARRSRPERPSDLCHIRAIVGRLPAVTERVGHGEPCFFVQGRRPLCYYHDDHHGDGRRSLWCPLPPGVADGLVAAEPDRFFAPTPSATGAFSNWVAMYLDTTGAAAVDWAEVEAMLEEAYRLIAPRRLIDRLRPQRH